MSFLSALRRHNEVFQKLSSLELDVFALACDIEQSIKSGGKILFMGNGGSAADCQHLAAEFVVRYKNERPPIAALALTVDTSILTAHSNDYEYDTVFTRQIQALCDPKDIVIGISTSGNSANIINGLEAAKLIGSKCWGWTNEHGGAMNDIGVSLLKVPAKETARVQEAHLFIGHWLCEKIDEGFTSS